MQVALDTENAKVAGMAVRRALGMLGFRVLGF